MSWRYQKLIDDNLRQRAMQIARTADVATPKDCAVFFSVSFLPTKENKDMAFAYIAANPQAMTIEQTACGKALLDLHLENFAETEADKLTIAAIWAEASKRYVEQASGNITAFVHGADPRGVFLSTELPAIMRNPAIITINGVKKQDFIF